jgi:hypothetical protein
MDVPLQLVHDVSRNADAARGFQTYAALAFTTLGGGADTFVSLTRTAFLAQTAHGLDVMLRERQLQAADVDVWVMGVTLVSTAATHGEFDSALVGVTQGTIAGSGVNRALAFFVPGTLQLISGGAVHEVREEFLGEISYPFILEDDESSAFVANVIDGGGGACIGTVFYTVWICPKGTFPPLA